MRPYFEKMDDLGKPLRPAQQERMKANIAQIEEVMKAVEAEGERIKNVGIPVDLVHKRGEMTVWERIEYLVDPGTFRPLHTIYDPESEESGSTGVVDGLARIAGKWCVLIGFNNKWIAGAWIAGQADNNLRVTDIAKIMNLPLVWLVNCSGVKLPEQEKVYANRRGQGTCFFRHAELEQMGIPVMAGIYGTNPAGGGYQGISPTILLAHKNCNIAVGGGGIVSGMSPKGSFDEAGGGGADRGDAPLQVGSPGEREDPLRRDGILPGGLRDGDAGARRPEGVHGGYAGVQPAVFPGGRPGRAEVRPGGDPVPGAPEHEGGLRFRQCPGAAGGQLGAPGVSPRFRPGGLHGSGEDRRVSDGGDREPPGTPAELPGIHQRLWGRRREALPAGADQDE